MKLKWDPEKNAWLKMNRGYSFEEITKFNYIRTQEHHSRNNQQVMLFEVNDYIWVVPFVENESGEMFLKTAYPSRKENRNIRKGDQNEHKQNQTDQS